MVKQFDEGAKMAIRSALDKGYYHKSYRDGRFLVFEFWKEGLLISREQTEDDTFYSDVVKFAYAELLRKEGRTGPHLRKAVTA